MTDQEDNINLGKFVFDDSNRAKILGLPGTNLFRSLFVFLYQLFVILFNIFGCFWRIHLSKFRDESTVWVRILCSAADYEQVNFYKKIASS